MEQLMALACSLPSRQQISWRTGKLQLNGSRMFRSSQQMALPPLSTVQLQRQQSSMPTPAALRRSLRKTGCRSATQR
jgi:hypothetical protein